MTPRALINLEAVFALLVIGAVLLSRRAAPEPANSPRRWALLLLLLLLPAAYLWTLTFPLISDDFFHLNLALHFDRQRFIQIFTVAEPDRFFRPLGYLSYALDVLWAGRSPALWHLSALLLHFVNCGLVYLLARRLRLNTLFAVTAALLFGLHGTRPEAVTWVASRFDLLATFFTLATLYLYLEPSRLRMLALLTALLALISKESAYVLPLLLLLITERPQCRRAAPFAALTAAVFAYRWHLLHGIGGYQTASHTPAILNFNLVRTLNAMVLRLWAALFFPINWSIPPEWWLIGAIAAAVIAYAVIGLRTARDSRIPRTLLFTFVAALPVQQLLLIGPDLEKSRVLYLPAVGFALFLAVTLDRLRTPQWQIPAALALIAFQGACLEHNLVIWRGVAREAQRACDSVAAALEPNQDTATILDLPNVRRGVYFLYHGFPDCLEVAHGIDSRRIQDHGQMTFRWDTRTESVIPVCAATPCPAPGNPPAPGR